MIKHILIFLTLALCFLFASCSSENTKQSIETSSHEYLHSADTPPYTITWNSFEEIAELKNVFEHNDDIALLEYLNEPEHAYAANGFYSKDDVNKFFNQFDQMMTFSLDQDCKLRLCSIQYLPESSILTIHYQKGSGPTFEQRIGFVIYPAEDGAFAEVSNELSELTAIDSIDIASQKTDLFYVGSYEAAYGETTCGQGCFKTDNSYIVINYGTINESAVLDPCIKDHIQMTSLNELIGEHPYVETPRRLHWSSFEEIAELKEALAEYDSSDFYDYLKENTQIGYDIWDGYDSEIVLEDFFEKINQKTAVLLDKDCKFKFEEIVYDYDADSLTISYQEEGEAAFKRRIEFTILLTDDNFKRYSDFLSECNQIDSINLEAQKIDLYATGSYENKSHTVMCSRGCFEKDNYYITINYNTVNESAVLDPCIKEHLQLTNLNELIG